MHGGRIGYIYHRYLKFGAYDAMVEHAELGYRCKEQEYDAHDFTTGGLDSRASEH